MVTAAELAVKLAETARAGTVTEAGTLNAALFEERLTTEPPASAARFSETVQDVVAPPGMLDGTQLTPETCGVAVRAIVRIDCFTDPA